MVKSSRINTRISLGNAIWWLVPIVFLFVLYADGLQTWFAQDDFAWLSLLRDVHSFRDVVHTLFAPAAQGTIRPWSERGFFLLFESLFGLDSLPFRICVFVTMAADLTLVAWITRRITGSSAAGAFAAMLWTANTALVTVMSWSSSYNEALCSLFLLGALALFIRYAETGRTRLWWWQLVVFTLGFGALEINVVYPALAAAYVLFVVPAEKRRRLLIGLIPLFCISVAYFLVHRAAVSLPADGPYALHVDRRIFRTLGAYWKWSLVPQTWKDVGHSRQSERAIVWILTLALLAFSVKKLANRQYQILFFALWYLITLAPMLPLPNHRSDYYLTIPLIGLAMLGGWGVSQALRSRWTWQVATLIPMAVYLGCMIPVTRTASRWWLDRSQGVRGLVLGVQAAEATHPGKTIVLDGITSDLYNASLADSAVTSVGLKEVYLTPTARDTILPVNDSGRFPHLVMEPGPMRNAITHDEVVVYSDVGDHLRNITGVWERSQSGLLPDPEPRRIEVGNPLLAYLLGPEWFPLENGFRWMPARATVHLGGPRSTKDQLLLEGYCPRQLKGGDVHLSVSVDGIPLGNAQIINPEGSFRRLLDMPPSLTGKSTVTVAIAVDQVINEPGGRELGLTFGTIAIQ
jgi:Dolichyl-phosphate-mannose-protein mannosyltransferase